VIILPEIVFIHSPSGIFAFQKDAHTFLLIFPVDLHKEFQKYVSVIRQLPFKSADAVNPFYIIIPFQFFVHALPAGLIHPSGIQECKFTGFRDLLKIPVKKWFPKVLFCRR